MADQTSRSIDPQTDTQIISAPPKEYAVEVTAVLLGGDPHLTFTLDLGSSPTPPSPEFPITDLKAEASIGTSTPLTSIGSETKPSVTTSESGFDISFTSPTFPVNTEVTVQLVLSGKNSSDEEITFTNLTDNTYTTQTAWTD